MQARPLPPPSAKEIKHFWDRVQKTEYCWEWSGCKYSDGYGQIKIGGKKSRTHRVSWILHFNTLPSNLHVLHKCDNPICVNPDHLFLGTQGDNMDDKTRKGRASGGSLKGETNKGGGKLSSDEVQEIRRRYDRGKVKQSDLAIQFQISQVMVSRIILGKSWTHI